MLSKLQKSTLAREFDCAFNRAAALARGRGEQPDTSTAARTQYRHEQVAIATGKVGLRCCDNSDYSDCMARAKHLLGEDGQAMNHLIHGQSNRSRQFEFLIQKELDRLGLPLSYAAGICRRMFHGLNLLEASQDQLFKILCALRYQKRQPRPPEKNITPVDFTPPVPTPQPA